MRRIVVSRLAFIFYVFGSAFWLGACELDPCDVFAPGRDMECTIGDRVYDVHVPANYAPNQGSGAALVIDMHGLFGTKEGQRRISGWLAVSDQQGFVLVTPQGFQNAWNGQLCCAGANARDDVAFLTSIVDRALASNRIDPGRVYATGLSNGGSMSHRLGCDAADVFAGIAPVSYQLMPDANGGCNPAMGLDVIHFHGTADTIVPYDTGRTRAPISLPSVESNERWAAMLSCTAGPVRTPIGDSPTSQSFCDTFSGCADGARVSLCTVVNGPHGLYGNSEQVRIAREAWDFLEAQ